jgi:Mrp family chromosome partitioning ATPase
VSTLADASAVASAADGVILVVDLQRTRRRDIVAAKKQLRNARTDLRGIVLNRAAVERPPYAQDDFDDPLADQPRH